MFSRKALAMILVLLAAASSNFVFSQSASTGQISGSVRDKTDAILPGVKVTVAGAAGVRRSGVTDDKGDYVIPFLPPGTYRLEFALPGFKMLILEGVAVKITETTRVDVTLEVAEIAETVTVAAELPLLQTSNPTTGRVIEEKTIRELPLATRNFTQLLALSPGTFVSVPDNAAIGLNSVNIAVNGSRPLNNNLLLNNIDANQIGLNNAANLPIPATDTIQEFKVQTSLYDASFGRSGGGVISAVTKSGTEEFHGNVYEFFRNEVLNANNFFFNATGTPRPILRRNQFGGTLGGPIAIPGIYDGRRRGTFFFISYQGSRERNGASLQSSVSSLSLPAGLTDDRSRSGISAATGGAVPPEAIDPVALRLLQARLPNGSPVIPSPQIRAPGLNFTASVPAKFQEDQFNVNIDHNVRSNNKLAGKFFFINYPTEQEFLSFFDPLNAANVPGFGGKLVQNNRSLSLVDTHTITPRLVNEARFGFNRVFADFIPSEPVSLASVGMSRFNSSFLTGIPSIQVLGSFKIGPLPIFDVTAGIQTFTYGNTISYIRGKHSVRAGFEFRRSQENFEVDFFQRGAVVFLSFNDFVAGKPFLSIAGSGILNRAFRNTDFSFFFQDDIKLSESLTINAGLRYEIFGPASDKFGRHSTFDPRQHRVGPPPNGFVLAGNARPEFRIPGVPLVSDTLLDSDDLNNFAPRFGLAYRPFGAKSLVLRTGYGIFYSRVSNEAPFFSFINPPFALLGVQIFPPGGFANPLPDLPLPSQFPITPIVPGLTADGTGLAGAPISAFVLDPTMRTPYMQHYNLTLQYEFAKDFLLEVGYVGSKGTKLLRRVGIAQALLASPERPVNGVTTNTPANALLRARFLGFSPNGLSQFQTSGNSNYNSLQLSVAKRFSKGLQFLAAYTVSKSIDDADTASVLGDSRVPSEGDQNALSLNRAVSDFDRPQRFVLSFTYDLPSFNGGSALLRKLLSGWEIAGIATFQSGLPIDIVDSRGASLFGGSNPSTGVVSRASFAAGASRQTAALSGPVNGRLNRFFNTSAFAPAPTIPAGGIIIGSDGRPTGFIAGAAGTTFGTLGRNILRGPDQRNVDLSLIKKIPIAENQNIEFRAEFFNIFNTVNFANPGGDIAAPDFGVITATSTSPRIIQFALKFNF